MESENNEKVHPPMVRLSSTEAESLIQARLAEAKRQRLSEVRQQSRGLSRRVQQRRLEYRAKFISKAKATFVRQTEDQLKHLKEEAELFLLQEMSHFGQAHNEAKAQPDFAALLDSETASHKRLAKQRGTCAFLEMKFKKQVSKEKATAHLKARKAALQVEAVRASYQASRPTPEAFKPPPKQSQPPKAVIYQYGSLYQSTFQPPPSIVEPHPEVMGCDPRVAAKLEEERIAEIQRISKEQQVLAKRRGSTALAYEKNAVKWRQRLHELEEEEDEDTESIPDQKENPLVSEKTKENIPESPPHVHPTHEDEAVIRPLTTLEEETSPLPTRTQESALDPVLLDQLRRLLTTVPNERPTAAIQGGQEVPERDSTPPQSTSDDLTSRSKDNNDCHPPMSQSESLESSGSMAISVKLLERFDKAIEKALYRKTFHLASKETASKENVAPSSHSSTRYRGLPKLHKSVSADTILQQTKQGNETQTTRRDVLKHYIAKLLQSQRDEPANLSTNTTSNHSVSSIHLGAEAKDFPQSKTKNSSSSSSSIPVDQIDFNLPPPVPPFNKSWPSFASASSATSISSKSSALPTLPLSDSTQASTPLLNLRPASVRLNRSRESLTEPQKENTSRAGTDDSLGSRLRWLEEQIDDKSEPSTLPLSTLLKEFRRFPDSEEKRNQVYAKMESLRSFSVSEGSSQSKSISVNSSSEITVPDVDAALKRLGMPALRSVLRR